MDAERSTLSVLNSSPNQSNGLINVSNHWIQVMERSSPVQPAQGLINTEVQWVNDGTSVCVVRLTNYMIECENPYASLPTGPCMFAGWIVFLMKNCRRGWNSEVQISGSRTWEQVDVSAVLNGQSKGVICVCVYIVCMCGGLQYTIVSAMWMCIIHACACVWGVVGGGARCGQVITAMNGPAKYLMNH